MLKTMQARPTQHLGARFISGARALSIAGACAAVALAFLAAVAAPAVALGAAVPRETVDAKVSSAVSSNWAGYVAHPASSSSGERFQTVSGSWTEPSVTCKAGRATSSAIWIGLGGYRTGSKALEQVGTAAECSRTGRASYASWFELVPAAPVALRLSVHAGDQIGASVTVIGHDATLRLRDVTNGTYTSTTRRLSESDTSSAEWIVEAPSLCSTEANCQTLPLTDFGSLSFQRASATTLAGHVGAIADGSWLATRIVLRQSLFAPGEASVAGAAGAALVLATPSASASSAFSVGYSLQEAAGEVEAPGFSGPTAPGVSGGA
jgi:peptidase A4-like protein